MAIRGGWLIAAIRYPLHQQTLAAKNSYAWIKYVVAIMKSVRLVKLSGEKLLPPNCSPIIPEGIADEELVRVIPPLPPWSPADAFEGMEFRKNPTRFPQFDDRYWQLAENNQHPTDTLFAWKNNPGSGTPIVGHGCGLDRVPPIAEFKFKPKARKLGLPDYWQMGGVLVISSRILELLREVDASAIDYRPVRMSDLSGNVFDQDHFLVDVTRVVWAVDFANSTVEYHGAETYNGERSAARAGRVLNARFRDDMDSGWHIFRQRLSDVDDFASSRCFVSKPLKRRLESLRPKPRNLRFVPLYQGC